MADIKFEMDGNILLEMLSNLLIALKRKEEVNRPATIIVENNLVSINMPGVKVWGNVKIIAGGYAILPGRLLYALAKVPGCWKNKQISCYVINGEINFGGVTLQHDQIYITQSSYLVPPIPIAAPFHVIIAFYFQNEKLIESGVYSKANFQEALKRLDNILERAAKILSVIHISKESLRNFISEEMRRCRNS